ncbi:hypothetical protein Celal_3342 [Cellulophaga algicola DSM 14237]|uniref:Uncharacterized protein n=1 Tax=Cellulophaga algicola (strain DSM 14237 / IC166 / ACAM 630) TaxID=688270 RepID=E6X649_CELAD|nr:MULTISPECIES: hypothetical protein [Cellulophaga]ADV50608.1 hypothetical protein Celal_3342 [Cellulophaga algicola DSM 14237]
MPLRIRMSICIAIIATKATPNPTINISPLITIQPEAKKAIKIPMTASMATVIAKGVTHLSSE